MISNRVLSYMTILVILGMAVLFGINLKAILSGQAGPENYVKYNDIRGTAVKHKKLTYTLNFDQQNEAIRLLNQAIAIGDLKMLGQRTATDIEQIVIYQFNNQPPLILTPVAYFNDQLVFVMPEWNPKGYLMDMSNGKLKKLLSQTYDP